MASLRLKKRATPRSQPKPEAEEKRFRISRSYQIWVNDMPEPSATLYRGESDDQGNLTHLILKRAPGLPPTKKVAIFQGPDFYNCRITTRFSDNYKGQKLKIRPGLPNHGERPEYVPEAEIDLSMELTNV